MLALARRCGELNQIWAQARIRRSQIRSERARLRAQMQLRRAWLPGSTGRAAAAILEAALSVSGLTLSQLWLDYVALGGSVSEAELGAMLAGTKRINRSEHDRIAVALNEKLQDAGLSRLVAYWDGSR